MNTYIDSLLERYIPKGILIDANLALLYLVGSYDLRLVGDGKYNKLSKFDVEDYHLLLRLKNVFTKAVTTPHVLTEVSNLVNDLPERTKSECLKKFYETFVEIDELVAKVMPLLMIGIDLAIEQRGVDAVLVDVLEMAKQRGVDMSAVANLLPRTRV